MVDRHEMMDNAPDKITRHRLEKHKHPSYRDSPVFLIVTIKLNHYLVFLLDIDI